MCSWDYRGCRDGPESSHIILRRMHTMKKIMSIMLGLTLAMGAVSVAFAQDKTDDTSKKEGKKKGKKKEDKKDDTSK
jgi:hypothetical protein